MNRYPAVREKKVMVPAVENTVMALSSAVMRPFFSLLLPPSGLIKQKTPSSSEDSALFVLLPVPAAGLGCYLLPSLSRDVRHPDLPGLSKIVC